MTYQNLTKLNVDQLVEQFSAMGLAQDRAIWDDNTAQYNELFEQVEEIKQELRRRPGDQRRALLGLYEHANIQVRLMAAKATLAVAPAQARKVIEAVAASHRFHYAGAASMCLEMLDKGVFIPD